MTTVYECVIDLAPRTKKTHQQIVQKYGRPIIIQSRAYRQYEKDAMLFIRPPEKPIDFPVAVKAVFYMPTRRRVDLTNLLEALDDILVRAGVLLDDNCNIVASHDGSRVAYDKASPRTEVFITRVADGSEV